MQTYEERLEAELEEKRQFLKEYATEKEELRQRLRDLETLVCAAFSDEQPDVAAFGRGEWVYCRQHVKPHPTGWCSVGVYDKLGLGVETAEEAYVKCREFGLPIYGDDE